LTAIQQALERMLEGSSLGSEAAQACIGEIMAGVVSEALLAAFLTALRMKGETPAEIAAFATVMRKLARKIPTRRDRLLDTCGTGGDGLGSFNVSTLAALVAAGAGAVVAKHGNRAVSGRCGSADLLADLGVEIECDEETVGRCLDEAGIGFLFAPALHPALRHAASVRRALGFRTVFNLVAPLAHPAGARFQLVGVYDRSWVEPVAEALKVLGSERALVVHGLDGMDEITTTAPTVVAELDRGEVRAYQLDARDLGVERADPSQLKGGDTAANAAIAKSILAGDPGPRRDLVLVNSAAALWASGRVDDLGQGLALARSSLDSGAAAGKLEDLRRLTALPRKPR
jgi:anthranilate phosphoribosyltransferase